MDHRLARIKRLSPRAKKVRFWRRNRWGGARTDRSDPRMVERNTHGRPWEGRGPIERDRQQPRDGNESSLIDDNIAVADIIEALDAMMLMDLRS